MPTITAVVLAYNRPHLLKQALASVQGQRRRPDEILVIDDHSDPPLAAEGVRLIRQTTNQGPGAAAARGLSEATGESVAFLNDDDLWAPDLLERLDYALDAHPDACIAFCDHGAIDQDGVEMRAAANDLSARYGRTRLAGGPVALSVPAIIDQAIASASFALTRREALSPELLRAGGDLWDYFLSVGAALTGQPGVYVNERLGWYRLSPDGVSAGWARPDRAILTRGRHLAIGRLALASRETRGIRRILLFRAFKDVVSAMLVALRDRSPHLLVLAVRECVLAVFSPTRAPVNTARKS